MKTNKQYKTIIRNRDNKGYILTYSVTLDSGYVMECNTLAEARLFAMIIGGN